MTCQSAPGLNEPATPPQMKFMPSMNQIAGVPSVVLPQDVGLAVAVVVAGALDVPARPRIRADSTHRRSGFMPFISQIAGWPLSFCHRMSDLPSLLKSPVPLICQLGPGFGPAAPPPIRFRPFISQMRGLPSLFCHRMSDLPSLLKSPVRLDLPARPRIERAGHAAGYRVQAVHQPDRGRAVVVLPQDVGLGVEVEVAGRLDLPARPRIDGPAAPVDSAVKPFISQIAGVPSSFCHRMSDLPSPSKSPSSLTCQPGPGLGNGPTDRRR